MLTGERSGWWGVPRLLQADEDPLDSKVVLGFQCHADYQYIAIVKLFRIAFPNKDIVMINPMTGAAAANDTARVFVGASEPVDFAIEGPDVFRWMTGCPWQDVPWVRRCKLDPSLKAHPVSKSDTEKDTQCFQIEPGFLSLRHYTSVQVVCEPQYIYHDDNWCGHDRPPSIRMDTALTKYGDKVYPQTAVMWTPYAVRQCKLNPSLKTPTFKL